MFHANHVLVTIKCVIQATIFVVLTYDEVTTSNNHTWIFVHGYCVQDWCRILILLSIEHILEGSNIENMMKVILSFLIQYRMLNKGQGGYVLTYVYGVSTFQGAWGGVIVQI
jgi:hypothetical protein